MICHTSFRVAGSRPVVGSSRNSTWGGVHQGGGNLAAALLATGEGFVLFLEDVLQLQNLAQPVQLGCGLAAVGTMEDAPAEQVLPDGEQVVQHVLLVDDANLAADLFILLANLVAADGGGATIGAQQGREHVDGGGLACAVNAQETQHGALFNREADVVYGSQVAVGFC